VIADCDRRSARSRRCTDREGIKGRHLSSQSQNEAPPKLSRSTIPEQLAQGRVFISTGRKTSHPPVFGNAALTVSPRLGHLHYYLDDQSWPTVDTSGETVSSSVETRSAQGQARMADATHKPIPGATQLVEFTVPPRQ